jgi:hypothetical protein
VGLCGRPGGRRAGLATLPSPHVPWQPVHVVFAAAAIVPLLVRFRCPSSPGLGRRHAAPTAAGAALDARPPLPLSVGSRNKCVKECR